MEQRDTERKAATKVGMLFPFARPPRDMTTHTNAKMLSFLLITSIFPGLGQSPTLDTHKMILTSMHSFLSLFMKYF